MKLKLIVAATLLSTSTFVMADAYRAEVGVNVARFDASSINSSSNIYEANGTYYFNLVNTTNLPLAEAAYLGKNSNAFLNAARNSGHGYFGDSNIYSGGVEVYIPENFLYVRVEGNHQRAYGNSDTSVTTTLGLTPIDGLRLSTSWNSDDSYHGNLDAKYVTALGNGNYINVEASVADTDAGTYKSVGGDYYFDNTFSVGAEVSDDDYGSAYLVRTRKFFTEKFSADLTFADTDNGNIYGIGANYRF